MKLSVAVITLAYVDCITASFFLLHNSYFRSCQLINMNDLHLVISTYSGLEEVLEGELKKLGAKDTAIHTRAVSCTGDMGFVYKANLGLRTALRVMVRIGSFPVLNADDLYRGISLLDWNSHFNPEQTFAVKCLDNDEIFDNNLYPALKVKDAIADQFRSKSGKRPDVDRNNPDIEIMVFISKGTAQVFLNSSGPSLHLRGYREEVDRAPLSEVLAAGIVMLSGWEPHKPLVDFMCGSGTIPVEAALLAAQVPPGIFRKRFGFQAWSNFEEGLFHTIREKQVERITESDVRVYGNELNRFVVKKAEANVKNAGVEDMVTISCGDFRDFNRPSGNGVVIINPPYGEKLKVEDVQQLYKSIGDYLKKNYAGYKAWIFTGSPEGASAIGLRPFRRIKLFNGPIECRLLGFDLFEGSKADQYRKQAKA